MVMPGLINLDFADVRTVMAEMGTAMMGTGESGGPNRALDAAHGAMANPLLDIVSMRGAKGVLINITGGFDMTLYEVDQAANEIRAEVDANANIILGSTFDETLEGKIRVSVVATGIDDEAIVAQQTVVEPARRAAEAPPRRPVVTPRPEVPREPAPRPVREPSNEEPRPSIANDAEPERRKSGGFSMFGWKKPEARDDEPRDFNLDVEPEEVVEDHTPRRAHEDVVRDPALDEELEIPAFLRRQMNPR
jgi:cell division protein FtsZ